MTEYRSLQNIAYDNLREMIYSRELAFEMIYSETRLAGTMNISRTPMRDALNRLSRERYIDILPNRGFQLHKPDEDDIREAYHVRMMIEGYCAEILAREYKTKGAQQTLDKMQACLDHQVALLDCERSADLRKFWLEDEQFHSAPLKYLNISALNLQFDTFLHIFMPQYLKENDVLGRQHSTVSEHRAIIDGLRTGDAEKTREAVKRHLDTSLRLAHLKNEEAKSK